nr:protein multipolar spindle 1 isoform X1 [Tanacetum cinerariifolium]
MYWKFRKLNFNRTRQRRYKVVSKVVDVQEVEATALVGRDRYIEGYEVEGHQKRLKLAEGHVEVERLLTLYQACIHDFMFYGHSIIVFCLPYPEDSIKNITSHEKITNSVEGIIGSLSLLLVRKMCTTLQGDGAGQVHTDTQFHVQHLLRKRAMLQQRYQQHDCNGNITITAAIKTRTEKMQHQLNLVGHKYRDGKNNIGKKDIGKVDTELINLKEEH